MICLIIRLLPQAFLQSGYRTHASAVDKTGKQLLGLTVVKIDRLIINIYFERSERADTYPLLTLKLYRITEVIDLGLNHIGCYRFHQIAAYSKSRESLLQILAVSRSKYDICFGIHLFLYGLCEHQSVHSGHIYIKKSYFGSYLKGRIQGFSRIGNACYVSIREHLVYSVAQSSYRQFFIIYYQNPHYRVSLLSQVSQQYLRPDGCQVSAIRCTYS